MGHSNFHQLLRDHLQDIVLEHDRYATIQELAELTGATRKRVSRTIYNLRQQDFAFCPPAGNSGDTPDFDARHSRRTSTAVRRVHLARATGAAPERVRTGDEARRERQTHSRLEAFWTSVRTVMWRDER